MGSLPTEIIGRIIELGCEEIPQSRCQFRSKPRRLKPFVRVASNVCRDWRALVHTPPNDRLWYTRLVLSYLPDSPGSSSSGISDNISRFKYLLSESRLSDLDVWMIFPMDNNYFVMRLMLHAFALLAPYSHQIRILRLWSQPLRALLSILNDFKPLPRLASLNLEFPSTEVIPSPYDFLSVDHVDSVLDLSGESSCQEISLSRWGHQGEFIFPCNASRLTIRFEYPGRVKWRHLEALFRKHHEFKILSLKYTELGGAPPLSSYTVQSGLCFRSLCFLGFFAGIGSILTVVTLIDLPCLTSLELYIYPEHTNTPDVTLHSSRILPPRLIKLQNLRIQLSDTH